MRARRIADSALLGCLLLVAGCGGTSPDTTLVDVPRPAALERYDVGIRERLVAQRSKLDEALDETPADAARLLTHFVDAGNLYVAYGLDEEALACFTNARTLAPTDYRWTYWMGVLHEKAGRLDAAAAAFARTRELAPDDLATTLRLVRVELARNRTEAAVGHCERALARDPESAMAFYGLGRAAADRGDHEEAIAFFERALELQPEATAIYHPLGLAYRDHGDTERAGELLARAGSKTVTFEDPLIAELSPLLTDARASIDAGHVARREGDPQLAVQLYRQALAADPESVVAHFNLGSVLGELGAIDESEQHLRRTIALDPAHRDAHFNLATALGRSGRFEEAVEQFDAVLVIDPRDTTARFRRGLLLETAGREEIALAEYRQVLDAEPGHVDALTRLAPLLTAQNRPDEAERRLTEALSGDLTGEGRATLEVALGTLLASQRRYTEAIPSYQAGLRLRADQPAAQAGLAVALIATGRHREARDTLESGLTRLPGDHNLSMMLSRLLVTSTDAGVRDGGRALEMAQAGGRETGLLAYSETAAMALAELGRYPEAIELQRQLIARAGIGGAPRAILGRLEHNLLLFESGRPVRTETAPRR